MKTSDYEIIKIDEKNWRIEDKSVRAFLLTGAEKALLIDTGFGTGNIKETVNNLTGLPVMLVNTHADRDHIGGNREFEQAYMHLSEFDRYHLSNEGAVCSLWEGDAINLGGREFSIILIPGHTPGSIALLDKDNRVLVSGDTVQAGTIFMFGPGRNIDAYIKSLEKLNSLRYLFDTVYPSHGPFPVKSDIIPELINAANKLKKGELPKSDPPFEAAAMLYNAGFAQFLY